MALEPAGRHADPRQEAVGDPADSMPAHCYSTRILSPFHGTLHVVSVEHGDAETTDGLRWVL